MPPAPTLPGVGQDRREGRGRPEGALPLRVVTSIRTVLDYDKGQGAPRQVLDEALPSAGWELLQTLDRLQTGGGWSMVALR